MADKNQTLDHVKKMLESFSQGDFSNSYHAQGESDRCLVPLFNEITARYKVIIQHVRNISHGMVEIEFYPLNEKDELGKALNEMTCTLKEMAAESKKTAWIKTGQAELSNVIRGDQNAIEISKNVLSFFAKYMGILVGTLYRVCPKDENVLELIGSFAFARRKGNYNKIHLGEGLVGQCALEKEMILFSNVPDGYLCINSSLGQSVPKYIILSPLLINDTLIGVVELGSNEEFAEKEMELLRLAGEHVAIALKSALDKEKIQTLLDESKKQSEVLQQQQEELRCTNEELESQQDLLKEKNSELQKQADILKASEEELNLKTLNLEKQANELQLAKKELEKKADALTSASKYKSEFLANMSHELRTPLNSLLILSKSLSENEEGNLTKDQEEAAGVIYDGGKDLLNLINDILDLSKVEAGKLEVQTEQISIKSIIDNLTKIFMPLAKNKGIAFDSIYNDLEHHTIVSDGKRIEQVLKNFISNAIKFTQQGSVQLQVHLPSSDIQFTKSHLSTERAIGISVIDTGIGIPAEQHSTIFEAFHQVDGSVSRKYGGTGLGLSISRELTNLLNGEIHIKSRPDHGSTFTLYLPCEKPAAKKKEEVLTELQNTIAKILIVEDSKIEQQELIRLIRKEGISLFFAETAKETVEMLKAKTYDCMILDLTLPDISGIDLLESIRLNQIVEIPPVIVYSAKSLDKQEYQKLNAFTSSFVVKGSDAKERLLDELSLFLHSIDSKPSKEEFLPSTILSLEGTKVLLVDDDMRNTFALSSSLRKKGLNVVMADNGKMALETLEDNQDIQIIIMDIMMPVMDGYEAMEKIRKDPRFFGIPIIALTAKTLPEDKAKALKAGANDFLTKPVSIEQLLNLMKLWMSKTPVNG